MRHWFFSLFAWFAVWMAMPLQAIDRYEEWAKKFAEGPKAEIKTGTFFGTEGHEEFLEAIVGSDGAVAVLGNTWGPPFPATPVPIVLGLDAHKGAPLHEPGQELNKQGKPNPPSPRSPDRTGFLAVYEPDLMKVRTVVRFGYGVASITAALQLEDGSVIIGGNCSPAFRNLVGDASKLKIFPRNSEDTKQGPYSFADLQVTGDSYVAKLSADWKSIAWAYVMEGHNQPPSLIREIKSKELFINCHGMKRLSADGSTMKQVEFEGWKGGTIMAVNPVDGTMVAGGDHQSPTGREPWRKPRLVGYTPEGKLKWRLYDFDGAVVGHDRYRLVSDSAVRVASYSKTGELALSIWSDGGNSIATRNPADLDKPVDSKGIGMSSWGANVSSFVHLVKFDPETCNPVFYSFWASYLTEKPNGITVEGIVALSTGETAIFGSSASWLVQTPNAAFKAHDHEKGGRGNYVTIFNNSFSNALYSSALAPLNTSGITEGKQGIYVISTATGAEDGNGNKPPTPNALQPAFGGGKSDGHILLMELPK